MKTLRLLSLLLVGVLAVSAIALSSCTKIKHRNLIDIHETFEGEDGDDWLLSALGSDSLLDYGEASALVENDVLTLTASQDSFCARSVGTVLLSLNANITEVHRIELRMDFATSGTSNAAPKMFIRMENQEFEFDYSAGYDGKLCFVWEKEDGHKVKMDRKKVSGDQDPFVGINENPSGRSELTFVAEACADGASASCTWIVRDVKLRIWGS